MSADIVHNPLKCPGIAISEAGISELDGDRIILTIPRAQIKGIKLSYDTRAKNPFCQFFLGFIMSVLGLIGLVVIFLASTKRGFLRQQSEYLEIPLIPVALWIMTGAGLWLLAGVLRAHYHLSVETEKETYKLFFKKTKDSREIRQFVRKAQIDFGYEIYVSILEKLQITDPPAA